MGDKGNSGLTWRQILAAIDTHILFASNGRRTLVLWVRSVKQLEPRNNHERRLRKNIVICLWPLDQSAEGKGWGFIDMWDTDKLKYFVMIEFNNCFISQSLNLFHWIYWTTPGSEVICHFHSRMSPRRRKDWFPLRMSRMLFAAKHSWMTLRMSRPLLVVSYLQVT